MEVRHPLTLLVFIGALHPSPAAADCRKFLEQRKATCSEHEAIEQNAASSTASKDRAKSERARLLCEQFDGHDPTSTVPPCSQLADVLSILVEESGAGAEKSARSVLKREGALAAQPNRKSESNSAGTAGQTDAVPSIQPINIAGGAVAFAGTREGSVLVGTLTVNPWSLFSPTNQTAVRTMDLSVTIPIELDPDEGREPVQRVAVRARANIVAWVATDELNQTLVEYAATAGRFGDQLTVVLENAPSVEGCFDTAREKGVIDPLSCGTSLDDAIVRAARERAWSELSAARRAADRYYLGLDLRLDQGRLEEDVGRGTKLLGAIAGGATLGTDTWHFQLRGRAGVQYSSLQIDDRPRNNDFAFDFGAGVELAATIDPELKQNLTVSAGFEGAYGKGVAEARLDYTEFVLALGVPTPGGQSVELGLRVPVDDSDLTRGTTFTVAGDFGLLGDLFGGDDE